MLAEGMKDQPGASPLSELVYELKVDTVMTKPAITVTPATKMSGLRGILRDNRISGTPVVEGGALVGVISVEDFINWLAQGALDCPVGDRMTRRVVTACADEPLIHVVSTLEERGFGRLPVVDRQTRAVVGVITKGDIIAGLLRALEIGYRAEEIQRYRASHLFEDLIADSLTLTFSYHIGCRDILKGGEVSSKLKKSLRRLGVKPESVRRAAIAMYEAEMNVIIYAEEAEATITVDPRNVRIEVRDRGPGIPDVRKAMEPGFSTAPDWVRELGFGAGMGLANIARCAERFDIESTVGVGTRLAIAVPTGMP